MAKYIIHPDQKQEREKRGPGLRKIAEIRETAVARRIDSLADYIFRKTGIDVPAEELRTVLNVIARDDDGSIGGRMREAAEFAKWAKLEF